MRYVSKDLSSSRLDILVWERLYNQYLERFGMDNNLEKYLKAKVDLTNKRLKYVETGNRLLITAVNIAEKEVEKLDPSKFDGMTIDQCLIYLQKWGVRLDKRKDSIVMFKSAMDEYGKASREK